MPSSLPVSRTVVAHALLAGTSELLPIPFLDDALRDHFRHRLTALLARRHGVAIASEGRRVLALGPRRRRRPGVLGCLQTTIVEPVLYVLWKLIGKLIRKLTVVLAIKEAVDTVSRVLYEGFLVERALASGRLGAGGLAPEAVRQAIDAALAGFDHRPMERTARHLLVGGWRWLARLPGPLLATFQDGDAGADAAAGREPTVDRTADRTAAGGEVESELAATGGHLAALAARFEAELDRQKVPSA